MANTDFMFGSDHYMIVGVKQAGEPPSGAYNRPAVLNSRPGDSSPPSPAVHVNNIKWVGYDNVRDVSESGGDNRVNITTRDEARRGLSVEVSVTKTGQLTFQIRKRAARLVTDPTVQAILYAITKREAIALADLDGPMTTVGAEGQVGNYFLSWSEDRPVEGVAMMSITAQLIAFPDRISVASVSSGVPTFTLL